jgi:hypothetical protein
MVRTLKLVGAVLAVGLITLLTYLLLSKSQLKTADDLIVAGYSEKAGGMVFFQHADLPVVGPDGPYIIGDAIVEVGEEGKMSRRSIPTVADQSGQRQHSITVHPNSSLVSDFSLLYTGAITEVLAEAELPEQLIAISDVEGNLVAFTSLLTAHKVIDKQLNWTFGNGELVVLGDLLDRGSDVAALLWLVHKLEKEAEAAQGKVTVVLGNHETMNLAGDWRYADDRYKGQALALFPDLPRKEAYKSFFGEDTWFGRWLRSKPTLVRRGNYLFVHGGIHPDIADLGMGLQEINQQVTRNLEQDLYASPGGDQVANFLLGPKGPLWYRGLVLDSYSGEDKLESRELNRILNGFNAERVVIGHTKVDQVSTDYNGRVIRIDVDHAQVPGSLTTQGLLIEQGKPYRIDASGGKIPLDPL